MHHFSNLDYLQGDQSVKYDNYRKDRGSTGIGLSPQSTRSKTPIAPVLHPRTDFCPDCYNGRLIAEHQNQAVKEQKEESSVVQPQIMQIKAENEVAKQQIVAKKDAEKMMVAESPSVKYPGKLISPKITEGGAGWGQPDKYEYEGYGREHGKFVESEKEEKREKMREAIKEKLEQEGTRNSQKERLMNVGLNTCGNLNLPSFKPKNDNRKEYRNRLLEQIQKDREQRMVRRELEKTELELKLFPSQSAVNVLDTKVKQKRDYYESVKQLEQNKVQKNAYHV